jgi:hypothetical protein
VIAGRASGVTDIVQAAPCTVIVKNNNIINGKIIYQGTSHLIMDGNTVVHAVGSLGLELLFSDPSTGLGADNTHIVATIKNNEVRDKFGYAGVQVWGIIDSGDHGNVLILGGSNNFGVSTRSAAGSYGDVGALEPCGRIYMTTGTTAPPYGFNYHKNDIVLSNAATKGWIFTAPGTLVPGSDTFSVADTTNGIIASTNLAWASGVQHRVGQRIHLSDGTHTLDVVVGRVYTGSAQNRMQILSAVDGSVINLGSMGSGTITATATATYQAFSTT